MNKKSSIRFPASCSDNLKSKACPEPRRRIENPKWMGIFVSALIFALGGAVAEAQQPKKVPRIGYLSAVDAASESSRAEGVRVALRELGYIEGKNIAFEYRYAAGKRDRYPQLAAEISATQG
jgi:hypothetical protein